MKAAILDLDSVYFVNGTSNFMKAMIVRGVSEDRFKDIYFKSEMMRKYKLGLIDSKSFWRYAISEWGLKINANDILRVMAEGYELNPKKKEIMRILEHNNIRPIICSNNFQERIGALDSKFHFLEDFDCAIFSYNHNMLKPKLLDRVSKITGIENSEIAYFDDNPANIVYAKGLGMEAVLIPEPTRVLKALRDILG